MEERRVLGYAKTMSNLFPAWLANPHASYVLAAYGAAACALLGLVFFSLRAARRRAAEWESLKERRAKK